MEERSDETEGQLHEIVEKRLYVCLCVVMDRLGKEGLNALLVEANVILAIWDII